MRQFFLKIIGIVSICSTMMLATAYAETASTVPDNKNKQIKLTYDIYNKGMHVITVNATYTLNPTDYMVKARFSSAGIASLFFKLDSNATVNGIFQHGHALPGIYQSTGKDKNGNFRLVIDFNHGQKADITTLEPARESNRNVLTEDQMKHSLDILSAMTDLIYKVRTTGKCEDQFNLLDGLRSYSFYSQTVGESEMPSTWTSPYRGKALQCKIVAQQIGGFKIKSRNRKLLEQPQPGSIWFKNIDNVGYLPVRFDFLNPKMGMVTGVLRQVPNSKK